MIIGIIVVGIGAQYLAWRVNLPSILLLLLAGIVAGPVTGLLDPDALLGDLLVPVVSLSVAIILYEGGLTLRLRELSHIGDVVRNLATIGALVTWAGGSYFAMVLFGLDLQVALLLGAIFIVTGPTVIGPMLRHIRPVGASGPALKWEGIVTDPLGAMVAVLLFETILHSGEATRVALMGAGKTLVLGSLIGAAGALVLAQAFRRHLVPDYLQNPVSLVLVFLVFGACESFQDEAGLAGVTVMGIVLANQRWTRVKHIIEFKENLQVLLLSTIFVLLAARLPRSVVDDISWQHFAFLGILIFVVRPLGVFLSTWRSRLSMKERAFIAAVAPRGIVSAAVASVLALELEHLGVPGAEAIVPVAFFVIIGTVLFYSITAPLMARVLGISQPDGTGFLILGAQGWSRALARVLKEAGVRVLMVDSNRKNVMRSRMDGLAVVQENILAEDSLEELDLSGVGHFLALTGNDEVNALACMRMEEVLGRSHVFQLRPAEEDGGEEELEVGGRRLFGEGMTSVQIATLFARGWGFKATRLSGEFDLADYIERYGDRSRPLFILDGEGNVRIVSRQSKQQAGDGDTLLALVEPGAAQPAPSPGEAPQEDLER